MGEKSASLCCKPSNSQDTLEGHGAGLVRLRERQRRTPLGVQFWAEHVPCRQRAPVGEHAADVPGHSKRCLGELCRPLPREASLLLQSQLYLLAGWVWGRSDHVRTQQPSACIWWWILPGKTEEYHPSIRGIALSLRAECCTVCWSLGVREPGWPGVRGQGMALSTLNSHWPNCRAVFSEVL